MDKYTKIKKIGEGSFGKALLVRHKESGKQMVVKEINMSRMQRKERDEARKETAVLAQLKHPNIVMYRESFEEVGNLYIVMDYCDGGDLYAKINSQRGMLFKEEEVLDWFVQTCLAIKHIHDRKILHRDIKSQNIFLTRHGIVKLGDFGIAKVLNSTVELARTCIGTPYYLSPEIVENKPYNNKSDIWSLGCVLYELTTLKHAFEAGNMKNLVLKIIRGSYPPPPPRYSYELRSLINTLFKRSARDRPSINSVLKKPLLQARIKRFLSEAEVADEFSHTVMHGVKIQKALPAGGGRPLPPQPVIAKRPPSAGANRYNPASVYAPSVARKSKENRKSSDQVVRKSNSGAKKATPTPHQIAAVQQQNDLAKRRQELMDKEKRRRLEEQKKKEAQYAKQHKEIIDKQKMGRINKAREEGWKSVISSLESSSGDSNELGPSPRQEVNRNPPPAPSPTPPPAAGGGGGERGNYDKYNEWLERLQADRHASPTSPPVAAVAPSPRVPAATPMVGVAGALGWRAAPSPSPSPSPSPRPSPSPSPQEAAMWGQAARAKGAEAAEKARLLEEYHARKRQAAFNKARAAGVNSPRVPPPSPKPSQGTPQARPSSGNRREHVADSSPSTPSRPNSAARQQHRQNRQQHNNNDEEYLERLRQIRLQNFNERRAVKEKINGKPAAGKPSAAKSQESDERKKKIEALRAQANDRARNLKEQLEKKRRDMYDEQKRQLPRPVPAPAMTEALKAIGAVKASPPPSPEPCAIGMTAAMNAIGAAEQDRPKTPLQAKKEQILARLNNKPIAGPDAAAKPKQEAKAVDKSVDRADRPKWGEPVKPAVMQAGRGCWGEGDTFSALSQRTLEETASMMEATSAADVVMKPAVDDEEPAKSARKHWGGPANTIMNALSKAQLSETAGISVSSLESTGEDLSISPVVSSSNQPSKNSTVTIQTAAAPTNSTVTLSGRPSAAAPLIGSTITVARNQAGDTVVIRKAAEGGDEGDSATAAAASAKTEPAGKEIILEVSSSSEDEEDKKKEDDMPKRPPRTKKLLASFSSKPVIATKPTVPSTKPSVPSKPSIAAKPLLSAKRVDDDLPVINLNDDGEEVEEQESQCPPPPSSAAASEQESQRPHAGVDTDTSPTVVNVEEEEKEKEKAVVVKKEEMFHKVAHKEGDEDGSKETGDMEVEDLSEGEEEEMEEESEKIDNKEATKEDKDVVDAGKAMEKKGVSSEKLALGLTTGKFDVDVRMLRTCSEPDLSKLLRSTLSENPFLKEEASEEEEEEEEETKTEEGEDEEEKQEEEDVDEEEEDEELDLDALRAQIDAIDNKEDSDDEEEEEKQEEEDEDDDASVKVSAVPDDSPAGKEEEEKSQEEDEEDASSIVDESDEDLETMRESMMSLLQQSDPRSDDELNPSPVKPKKKSKKTTKKGKKIKKKKKVEENPEDAPAPVGRQWSDASVDDLKTLRETMASMLQPAKQSTKQPIIQPATVKESGDAAVALLNADTEAWQDDDDEDDADDFFEEDNMFSRIEETREMLERELGDDTFVEAYKTVQAIHEDEDDNMETGVALVTKILGKDKSHLYPSILQLVMSDGAFMEDNE